MKQYIIDPELEKCLPPLDDETYQSLKASLSENGYDVAFPIIIWKGHDTIVDGHHRNKACIELGIEPVIIEREFESLDHAILYAREHQDNRRNQTVAQKALNGLKIFALIESIAAKDRQKMAGGSKTDMHERLLHGAQQAGSAASHIGKHVGVHERTVYEVKAVLDKGVPELEEMLRKGELSSNAANEFVQNIPDKEEQANVARGGSGAINNCLKSIRTLAREAKKDRKFQEEQEAIKQDVQEYHAVQKEKFGGATYACGLSSVSEMWCNSCKCAFDVFKPFVAKCCPACASTDIEKRDEMWYPGMKVN